MPNYKDPTVFTQLPNDPNFDTVHQPGQVTPFSGIYKCRSCGFECASVKGFPLPTQRDCSAHHPQWKVYAGTVSWRLVAAAIHITKNA